MAVFSIVCLAYYLYHRYIDQSIPEYIHYHFLIRINPISSLLVPTQARTVARVLTGGNKDECVNWGMLAAFEGRMVYLRRKLFQAMQEEMDIDYDKKYTRMDFHLGTWYEEWMDRIEKTLRRTAAVYLLYDETKTARDLVPNFASKKIVGVSDTLTSMSGMVTVGGCKTMKSAIEASLGDSLNVFLLASTEIDFSLGGVIRAADYLCSQMNGAILQLQKSETFLAVSAMGSVIVGEQSDFGSSNAKVMRSCATTPMVVPSSFPPALKIAVTALFHDYCILTGVKNPFVGKVITGIVSCMDHSNKNFRTALLKPRPAGKRLWFPVDTLSLNSDTSAQNEHVEFRPGMVLSLMSMALFLTHVLCYFLIYCLLYYSIPSLILSYPNMTLDRFVSCSM